LAIDLLTVLMTSCGGGHGRAAAVIGEGSAPARADEPAPQEDLTNPARTPAAATPTTKAPDRAPTSTEPSSGAPLTTLAQETSFSGDPNSVYCQMVRAYRTQPSSLLAPASTSDLKAVYQAAARQVQAAVAVAPPEIAADVKTTANAVYALGAALARVNYNVAKLPVDALLAASSPTVRAASTRIQDCAQAVCGVRRKKVSNRSAA
jgi:hypothetical protein